MKWLIALALVGCKQKEGPPNPLAQRDAAVVAGDASVASVDAEAGKATPLPKKVVVGDHWGCALLADATLRCWGANGDGQLGDGTTTDAPTPVTPALHGVKDIVAGAAHACALLDDSSVTCWGRIAYGKQADMRKPSAPPGVTRASRIFAVGGAGCATLATGPLVCWGDVDVKGHLRRGDPPEHRMPTPARGLDRVTALVATGALHEDGHVSSLSTGATALTGVTEIAAAGDDVCGLREDGSVACAGPQLHCAAKPRSARRPKQQPLDLLKLPPAKHLAFDAGLCVISRAGKLECVTEACKPEPASLANVAEVSSTCARLDDGSARCWTATNRAPKPIKGVRGAKAIAASATHACALLASSVVCWGSNTHGALGRGKAEDAVIPQASAIAL